MAQYCVVLATTWTPILPPHPLQPSTPEHSHTTHVITQPTLLTGARLELADTVHAEDWLVLISDRRRGERRREKRSAALQLQIFVTLTLQDRLELRGNWEGEN